MEELRCAGPLTSSCTSSSLSSRAPYIYEASSDPPGGPLMLVTALEIAGAWLAVLVFAVALGRAAGKPTPAVDDRPLLVALDDVDFEWPEIP